VVTLAAVGVIKRATAVKLLQVTVLLIDMWHSGKFHKEVFQHAEVDCEERVSNRKLAKTWSGLSAGKQGGEVDSALIEPAGGTTLPPTLNLAV